VDWMYVAQDRVQWRDLVSTELLCSIKAGNLLSTWVTVGSSGRTLLCEVS
jgi:hypothetical protein